MNIIFSQQRQNVFIIFIDIITAIENSVMLLFISILCYPNFFNDCMLFNQVVVKVIVLGECYCTFFIERLSYFPSFLLIILDIRLIQKKLRYFSSLFFSHPSLFLSLKTINSALRIDLQLQIFIENIFYMLKS